MFQRQVRLEVPKRVWYLASRVAYCVFQRRDVEVCCCLACVVCVLCGLRRLLAMAAKVDALPCFSAQDASVQQVLTQSRNGAARKSMGLFWRAPLAISFLPLNLWSTFPCCSRLACFSYLLLRRASHAHQQAPLTNTPVGTQVHRPHNRANRIVFLPLFFLKGTTLAAGGRNPIFCSS